MDCRTALEILDCQGTGPCGVSDRDLAVASAHLAECSQCRAILRDRRRLDRKIGRVMRAVVVPRDAKERLLTQLAALEAAPHATDAVAENRAANEVAFSFEIRDAAQRPPAANADHPDVVHGSMQPPPSRRWPMWRTLVPLSACVAVAVIAFFSVLWLMMPRWSVEDVRLQLARLDFNSLEALRNFDGDPAVSPLPADPGWHKLEWQCRQIPKGWPDTSSRHQFAVYGFVVPSRQRHPIRGLLAVVPRRQVSTIPQAQSIGTAPSGDYFSARLGEGEAVCVAWTEGDVVYVCLVEGGEEPLSTLRQMLGASAA
jgi:hypothetical protein